MNAVEPGRFRSEAFATDHREAIAELDVNPLICTGGNITAVDALIVPKS
jgi:hypothetical protein